MTYNGNCRSSELTLRISEYWYGKLGINAFSINVFIKIFFMGGGGTSYIRWLLIWPKIVLQCLLMRPLLKIRSSWDYLGINSRIFLKFSWEIQGIPGLVFFARNLFFMAIQMNFFKRLLLLFWMMKRCGQLVRTTFF